jgi:Acyl-CoA synthetases (AMP-forming)/AMP-acid ligases II
MTDTPSTIADILKIGADDAPALNSPGGTALSYRALRALTAKIASELAAHGIGANDRVAIVLDNGPEMAAAFLSIASAATAAPLNPTYRGEEFEFYLTDLRAKLLIVAQGKESPAVAVADKLGVPIARLVAHPERGAGSFDLEFPSGAAMGTPRSVTPPKPDDIALVLHTSGTTSRPKIVPLSHGNICASAANIRRTLSLTANDRGLVIMPLFHIHGLIAALTAPLSAGGEVSCSPGFNALKFFGWLMEVHPTWYTGVPTMHQAFSCVPPTIPTRSPDIGCASFAPRPRRFPPR